MKAVRQGYSEAPFFYEESHQDETRFVAWSPSEDGQEVLLQALLANMEERVEYLFKEKADEPEPETWHRISGGIYKDKLLALIAECREWFYADSEFQFCFREPESRGYVAYDDHGIFFIYERNVRSLLERLNMKERAAPLIYNGSHWHGRPKDAATKIEQFKQLLCASSEFYEEDRDGA